MSHVQNPIIGRAKGQAGGMVFGTLYGKNVMRSKPFQYRDKKSTEQVTMRSLFALAVALISSLKFFVVSFFETAPAGMSCYSKCISQIRHAFSKSSGGLAFNPANITLGSGSMPQPSSLVFTDNGNGTGKFEFPTTNLLSGQSLTDTMSMLVITNDGQHAAIISSSSTRLNGKFEFTIPADIMSFDQDVYVSDPIFSKSDGSIRTPVHFSGQVIVNS